MTNPLEIEKMVENYPKGRIPPRITWRLNKQIVEINGDREKNNITNFIESLPIMDSKHIRKFLNDNEPRLDLTRTLTTPSGKKVETNITFGVEFFRPFF